MNEFQCYYRSRELSLLIYAEAKLPPSIFASETPPMLIINPSVNAMREAKGFSFISHIECGISTSLTPSSATIFLELPVAVVKRTDLAGLEPAGDAVEVEGVLRECQ